MQTTSTALNSTLQSNSCIIFLLRLAGVKRRCSRSICYNTEICGVTSHGRCTLDSYALNNICSCCVSSSVPAYRFSSGHFQYGKQHQTKLILSSLPTLSDFLYRFYMKSTGECHTRSLWLFNKCVSLKKKLYSQLKLVACIWTRQDRESIVCILVWLIGLYSVLYYSNNVGLKNGGVRHCRSGFGLCYTRLEESVCCWCWISWL